MATPGELVKVIAASTGEDLSAVASHDRNLVVAGLRSKSGRGTSAAKVTSRDAANLLTAILGSARVKDSVETVRRYMRTQEHQRYWHQHYPKDDAGPENIWEHFGIAELTALPSDHSFIDALEVLITLAAEGRLICNLSETFPFDSLKIGAASHRTHARININDFGKKSVQADYGSSEPPPKRVTNKKIKPPPPLPASPQLKRWTETNALPIVYIGALLAGKLGELPPITEVTA